jgi:hypothetical protein
MIFLEDNLTSISNVLFVLAPLAGSIICLVAKRLSSFLFLAAAGFGGECLTSAVLQYVESHLTSSSASSSVEMGVIFTFFQALCILGLGLAFYDIHARLKWARRRRLEDDDLRRDRPSLPANDDPAPWRRPVREDDRDFQR